MIFRLALLLSLAVHAAVYCSVRFWPEVLSFGVKASPAKISLIEVGLIQPASLFSAPAAKEKKTLPRPEQYARPEIEKVSPAESRPGHSFSSRPAPEGRAGSALQSKGDVAGPELDLAGAA